MNLKTILRFILTILFRIKVIGKYETYGDHTLIIANHQSFLDGLILGAFLPISPVFVINTDIAKRPLIRFLLSISDYRVIDPAHPMAIKELIRLVESGRPIVIFPEGRITTTGSLMKIYEGGAFVAAKTGATVCPIIIEGAHFSTLSRMPHEHPSRWFPRITLTYATPTRLTIPEGLSSHERHQKAGEAMRTLMQRSVYEARPRHDLFEAFLFAANAYGIKRRIVEDTQQIEYTYKDLLTMSLALGKLVSRHTLQGENVGIFMPTAVPTLGLLLGLLSFGRVPALLNFTAGSEGLKSACTAAKVQTIITSRAFIDQAKLADKLGALCHLRILYLEDLKKEFTFIDKLWLIAYAVHVPHRVALSHPPSDPAIILFTSGSEGAPKGVVLSHEAILANIAQIRSIVDLSSQDKVLNALPIFHSFGLTAGTLMPILGGIQLFMYPSPLHYRIIPEIAYDRSCTVLFGTSTFLHHYGKHAHPYDFYRMRYVVSGAEKLSADVKAMWFEKFGIRIFEGYGATETAPVISVNTPMAYKSGTVGQLLPGIEYRLIGVAGIDEGGVLHVRGDNVMSGYLRAENPGILEKPSSDAGDGWYDTGDIVTIDEEGFLRIQGRIKRFAKIAGEMISLESVELLAHHASASHHHASSSRTDPLKGEAIVLFTTDPALNRETLLHSARELGYSELSLPKSIRFVSSIPLLGSGKTDYVTLKSMAEHG